jgi:hypothetical protein
MTLEKRVVTGTKNVAELNRLMRLQPYPFDSWISDSNTDILLINKPLKT